MPYCPTCKNSFEDDVTECPEHRVPLVKELPFQTVQAENTTWVEIASTGTEDEARILQGFLETEGIPAQIENVKFTMEPINFGAMGDIRIYVNAEDEQRAMALVRERNVAYEKLDDDDETLVTDDGATSIDENVRPESESE